jgi:acyl-coenzyme A synthetase/AMP-(fatty) acid ligase
MCVDKLGVFLSNRMDDVIPQTPAPPALASDRAGQMRAVPSRNRSGKIMRRLLRDIAEGRELGDTSTLVNPGVFEAIRARK